MSSNDIIIDEFQDLLTVELPDGIISTSMFKVKLKRFFKNLETFPLELDEDLSIQEIQSLVDALGQLSEKQHCNLVVTDRFNSYMELHENYVKERRELGSMIKTGKEYVQLGREEFSDAVNGIICSRPLRERQMRDAYYMCVMNKVCNFSVPGSGKTATALGTYAYLKKIGEVDRILLIGPINCFGSWLDEYESCFGKAPRYYNIQEKSDQDRGVNSVKYDLMLGRAGEEIYMFNYESVPKYEDAIAQCLLRNDVRTMVILDEVHRVKGTDSIRAQSTMRLVKDVKYLIAMTGTPIPNSYTDIYNLFNMVLGKNYKDLIGLNANELKAIDDNVFDKRKVNDAMNPFFCRTTKEQIGVPKANNDLFYEVKATPEECTIFNELAIQLRNSSLALIVRILQLESDPGMVLEKISDEDLEWMEVDSLEGKDMAAMRISNVQSEGFLTSKVIACLNLASSLVEEGKPVIIWCVFKRSISNLESLLRKRGFMVDAIYGDVPLSDRHDILNRFKEGNLQILIANPHTLAESVSLHTVCHDAIYFEYTYNLVHFLQSKDRINRLGLPEGQYTQYHIMVTKFDDVNGKASLDQAIYARLKDKESIMMDAIERGDLEIMPTDEEDLRMVMSKLFKSYRASRI